MSNFQSIEVGSAAQLARFCDAPGLPVLDPAPVARHAADAHWMVVDPTGSVAARCSLWWQAAPRHPEQRLGIIGHFAALNAVAAAPLLRLAGEQLAAQGCTLAVGPMDGNTWRSYRLVVERGTEPPFFLEPDHPADWPSHFTGNGFSLFTEYFSTLNPDLGGSQPDLSRVADRIERRGIRIRSLNLADFDQEMRRIYQVSLAGFARNFLYTPIDLGEFLSVYDPVRPYIRPELILIAEHAERAIAFLFALPDLLQTRRGAPPDTVIIKTVAVHPDYELLGLGNLLVARAEAAALALGYKRAIHALMHQANTSRKLSRRHATCQIRRYALFSKSL